jgi:hypothetical protein
MRIKAFALAGAALAIASVQSANSQTNVTAQQALASASYLIGTWSCAHTVGTFSGRYTTTYSMALGDHWLKQSWDFPPGNAGGDEKTAVTAETLMGYDEGRQTWVRFFANSLGQHFEIRMKDTPSGWSFKYSTFYPRTRPETPEPDAIFARKSDTEYTVDGPTYPLNGTKVTEHHSCHKV